ncbi:MAG: hypothetical protein HRT41_16035 [Campylobacteraceae bacterium]|nr:hypothetical protein [Campylobacterales bacterium]NQY25530.1 hypothetical protein [Campylobacteraceae bacterium]
MVFLNKLNPSFEIFNENPDFSFLTSCINISSNANTFTLPSVLLALTPALPFKSEDTRVISFFAFKDIFPPEFSFEPSFVNE